MALMTLRIQKVWLGFEPIPSTNVLVENFFGMLLEMAVGETSRRDLANVFFKQ